MAATPASELPSEREGVTRRTFMAALIGLCMLEIGLRILLGNFAQASLVQEADDAAVCVEVQPDAELVYTGWLQRIARSDVRTNAQGARGPAIDQRPRPGVLRIAAVGDEFTFGMGVDGEDAYVQVASRALQREGIVNELLNFAVPGHATPQAVAQVLDKVVALRPDVVLLPVFADDMDPAASWCAQPAPNAAATLLLRNLYTARLGWLLTRALRPPLLPAEAKDEEGAPAARFARSIGQLQEAGRTHDFAVVVVLLTDRDAFSDPTYCDGCPAAHDLVEALGVDVVDLSPVWRQLRADRDASFLRGEGHLTIEGSLRVGLQLGQALAGWGELQRRASDRSARLRP